MEPDKLYTMAFWAKVDAKEGNSRNVKVFCQLDEVPFTTMLNENLDLDSVDWKEYVLTFATPKDSQGFAWVGLLVGLSDIDFWIDDFRFFEGEPSDELKGDQTFVNPKNKIPTSWGRVKEAY